MAQRASWFETALKKPLLIMRINNFKLE